MSFMKNALMNTTFMCGELTLFRVELVVLKSGFNGVTQFANLACSEQSFMDNTHRYD